MSKIIVLRGNSGSGKSTVADALQKKIGRGTFLISQDYVRREMLWVKDRPNNMAIDLLKHLVIYGNQNCEVSILDGILYTDIYSDLFCLINELYAGQTFAYYFDIPFEETLKRHSQKPISNKFGETEMRSWWREKDFLKNINEKTIPKEMNVDDIVEMVYQDLTGRDSFKIWEGTL